jgi:endonuclease/exonuclease/phosphatase family metal-dependent hydrolase
MIAELVSFFRRGSRPLGRAFWWPGLSRERNDAAGVLLVSFGHIDERTRHRLLKRYRHYHRLELLDGVRPADRGCERKDSSLAVLYRFLVFLARSLYFARDLVSGKLSWANHICECDGLARAHQAIMLGLPYHHLGDLRGRRWRDLRHLERLMRTLEHRRYEIWLIFRDRREAYVPASLSFPDAPLKVSEVEQLAQHRCDPPPIVSGFRRLASAQGTIRIMTYNVHSCIGLDGRLSVRRVAEVLERYSPHFVALQEVDVVCRRTGFRDQLEELSRLWPSQPFFYPAMVKGGGRYGIGCLSRLPVREYRGYDLPRQRGGGGEPRVAIEARLELPGGHPLTVVNTHLGLTRGDRMAQISGLERIIDRAEGAVVVLGDFNCPPHSREVRRLLRRLQATSLVSPRTWFGAFPVRVLDYVLLRDAGRVKKSFVPIDHLTKVASDHLPLIVDLVLDGKMRPLPLPPAAMEEAGAQADGRDAAKTAPEDESRE